MDEDVFNLLKIINEEVNHRFVGENGSNREQRIADEISLKKYKILDFHGLIKDLSNGTYTITEYGTLVAQHKSWNDYLKHVRELNERKVKKEKLDLKISEFQVRTRNYPFILSIFGIIISAFALIKSCESNTTSNEIPQKSIHQLKNENVNKEKKIELNSNQVEDSLN